MELSGSVVRASLFIGADDTWGHTPLYHEIVTRARSFGLAGATVLRGMEGYGTHSVVHTTRLLDLAENLPVVVIIVDQEDRVRAFLAEVGELVADGAIVLDDVEVVRYRGRHG